MHVAWVWGPRNGIVPGNPPYHTKVHDHVLVANLFVNGKLGSQFNYRWYGNTPCELPVDFELGRTYPESNLDAVVDELRLSDVQRYTADFEPPSMRREFAVDEHTRALFHFNGDLAGESAGFTGALPAELTK